MNAPRVVSYVRMSTTKQEDSPERQRLQIARYAAGKGYLLREEYFDAGISGDDDERPGFKRLMADAAAGKFDLILMDEESRLARVRGFKFIATIAYPLQEAGVSVETAKSGPMRWDEDDLGGQITTLLRADQASKEVRNMSRRVLGGMAREARAAQWHSTAPFGYTVVRETDANDPRKIINRKLGLGNPLHVEAVKWMFNEYAAGRLGLASIASELAKRGVYSKTRTSKKDAPVSQPFKAQGIASILRNPVYVGDHVWNRVNAGKYSKLVKGVPELQPRIKRGKTAEADWVVVPDAHPALIDRDTFQKVQDRLKTNRRRTTPLPDGGGFKLSKLLVCGRCGAWMSGFTDRKNSSAIKYLCGSYYQGGRAACDRNKVDEAPLVRAIAGKLQESLLNPDTVAQLRAEVARQEQRLTDPMTRAALVRRLGDLNQRVTSGEARLLELPSDLLTGAVTALRTLKAERDETAAELAKIDAQAKPSADLERAIDDITGRLWRLREVMEKGAPNDVRAVLDSLLTKVVLHFDRRETGKIVRTTFRAGTICIKPPVEVSNLPSAEGGRSCRPKSGPPPAATRGPGSASRTTPSGGTTRHFSGPSTPGSRRTTPSTSWATSAWAGSPRPGATGTASAAKP